MRLQFKHTTVTIMTQMNRGSMSRLLIMLYYSLLIQSYIIQCNNIIYIYIQLQHTNINIKIYNAYELKSQWIHVHLASHWQ